MVYGNGIRGLQHLFRMLRDSSSKYSTRDLASNSGLSAARRAMPTNAEGDASGNSPSLSFAFYSPCVKAAGSQEVSAAGMGSGVPGVSVAGGCREPLSPFSIL